MDLDRWRVRIGLALDPTMEKCPSSEREVGVCLFCWVVEGFAIFYFFSHKNDWNKYKILTKRWKKTWKTKQLKNLNFFFLTKTVNKKKKKKTVHWLLIKKQLGLQPHQDLGLLHAKWGYLFQSPILIDLLAHLIFCANMFLPLGTLTKNYSPILSCIDSVWLNNCYPS